MQAQAAATTKLETAFGLSTPAEIEARDRRKQITDALGCADVAYDRAGPALKRARGWNRTPLGRPTDKQIARELEVSIRDLQMALDAARQAHAMLTGAR